MRLQSEFSFRRFHIRINWLVAACVIMTALSCGRLGLWQLERAAQKVEAQRLLQREQRENAGAIEAIPPAQLRRANPELQNRHVALRGEYDNARTILLTAEFFDGQIGYGVVTPFRLAGNGQLVLVSRGWTTGILAPDTPPYLGEVEGSAGTHGADPRRSGKRARPAQPRGPRRLAPAHTQPGNRRTLRNSR